MIVVSLPLIDIITFITNSISGEANSTSYLAHASGVVMGLLVGLVILTNRRGEFWETWLRILCCLTAVAAILVLVVLNVVMMAPDGETSHNSTIVSKKRDGCAEFLL